MPKPDVDYDGELAVGYERGRGISDEALATWRAVVGPLLPSSGLIADVGAGTGRYARPLAELAPGRVLAIEPATGMRTAAQVASPGAGRGVTWMGGSAERLPLADNSIDLIWTAFTTHSSLQLISDAEFEDGISRMRAAAAAGHPIYAPNVMLTFVKTSTNSPNWRP